MLPNAEAKRPDRTSQALTLCGSVRRVREQAHVAIRHRADDARNVAELNQVEVVDLLDCESRPDAQTDA